MKNYEGPVSQEELEVHMLEIKQTLWAWHKKSPEEKAFAVLQGDAMTDDHIRHLERYVDALQDHITYSNPTWAGVHTPNK